MKKGIAIICLVLSVGCAAWGYLQYREGVEAAQVAGETRAGRSVFEREPAIKQRLIEVADLNDRDFKRRGIYLFVAAFMLLVVGAGMYLRPSATGREITSENPL